MLELCPQNILTREAMFLLQLSQKLGLFFF